MKKISQRLLSKRQVSESLSIGLLLAVNGGFLESYTYMTRNRVFANAQSGNIVLIAIKLSEGDYLGALYSLIPIGAFVMGILIANTLKINNQKYHHFHWRQFVLLFQILILAAAGGVPGNDYNVVVIFCISLACSLQYASFKKIKGMGLATTFCTGNLRSASENLFDYFRTQDRAALTRCGALGAIILSFFGGALIGAVLTRSFQTRSVYFCCCVLFIAFLMMFFQAKETEMANTRS